MDKLINQIATIYKRDGVNPLLKISDIVVSLGLTSSPDATAIYQLSKASVEITRDYVQKRNARRVDKFHRELLYRNDALDQGMLDAELNEADFHALLDACISDIEEAKTTPYAHLTRSIALGFVPINYRRHFIHTIKELAFEHLDILREAYSMTKYSCLSEDGTLAYTRSFFIRLQTDSITRLSLKALLERGLITEHTLTPLGVCFVEACYSCEDLAPENFDYKSSRKERAAIVSLIDCDENRAIVDLLVNELRNRNIQVETSVTHRYDGLISDEPCIKFASYVFIILPNGYRFGQNVSDTLNISLSGKKSIQIFFDSPHRPKGNPVNVTNSPSINTRLMSPAKAASDAVELICT